MDIETLRGVLNSMDETALTFTAEIKSKYEENLQWLLEVSDQIEIQTSKSSVLLPKTPSASKRLRKRCPRTIPENEEVDDENVASCSSVSSYNTRSTRNTRNTRNTRQKLQSIDNVSPVLGTRNKRSAYKNASKKIKQQVNISITEKLHKHANGDSQRDIESLDILSSSERPSKIRKLRDVNDSKSMLPLLKKFDSSMLNEDGSINSNEVEHLKSASLNCSVVCTGKEKLSTINLNCTHVISSPGKKLKNNLNHSNKENMSPHKLSLKESHQCLLVERNQSNIIENNVESNIIENNVESNKNCSPLRQATLANRMSESENKEINHQLCSQNKYPLVLIKPINIIAESNQDHGPKDNQCKYSVSSNITSANINPTIINVDSHNNEVTNENSPPKKDNVDYINHSITNDVQQILSTVNNCEPSIEKVAENVRNSLSTENVEPLSVVNLQILQGSPSQKIIKLSEPKPKPVLSPFRNEPVHERVAAFEKLQTLKEEPAETKSPQQPTRVTRTKTRAMVAAQAVPQSNVPDNDVGRVTRTKTRAVVAAAKAAAASLVKKSSDNINHEANVIPSSSKDTCVEKLKSYEPTAEKTISAFSRKSNINLWKAGRKSLAKAKKISIVKEKQLREKIDEAETSKENCSAFLSTSRNGYYTPYCYNSVGRCQPLSSSNIFNSSTNSASRIYGTNSASKGRYLINKQPGTIIVGIDSFISKKNMKLNLEDIKEKRDEEIRRLQEREEEAKRKREQVVLERKEEVKRKREEKMQRVLQAQEILKKKKLNTELLIQKKTDKVKQTLQDLEDKKKEHVQYKKQLAQQKVAEFEERRKQEEAVRLKKIKEQEEEQRRLQEARKREQEEAERQRQKRLAEEKAAALWDVPVKVAQTQQAPKIVKEKVDVKVQGIPNKPIMNRTFDMSQTNSGSSGKKNVQYNDYEIEECSEEECNDGEEYTVVDGKYKKPIPLWARKQNWLPQLKMQHFKDKLIYDKFISCTATTPNIVHMFGIKHLKRTSSAVWRTPPRYSTLPKY